MSLVARHLEANGIPTVLIGSAIDIVEHCGVPRFLFVDFPLGNPCGRPGDADMQRSIVSQGLSLFEHAGHARTTEHADYQFGDERWRESYMEIREEDRAAMAKAGAQRREQRAQR